MPEMGRKRTLLTVQIIKDEISVFVETVSGVATSPAPLKIQADAGHIEQVNDNRVVILQKLRSRGVPTVQVQRPGYQGLTQIIALLQLSPQEETVPGD